jgi:phosphate transport system substrate-binding protein
MVGPTIGSLNIVADESIKDIVEQEEQIFERNYSYAKLNITFSNEYDMFRKLVADSVHVIMTTRALTKEEIDHFNQKNIHPRQYAFAKGAIAFITNETQKDTAYRYEDILALLDQPSKGKVFVIENAKSGISNVILHLIDKPALPSHFYALNSKKEVLDYIMGHDQAIGIVDWSDISDSDNPITEEILKSIHLVGISRPQDSIQHGFVKPFQYNLQDDIYPFTRELYLISTTGMNDVGMGFASFISGEIGQKIILKAGLLPKFQSERIIEIKHSADIKVVK